MAITRRGNTIICLAADTKPTASTVQSATELIESDTRKRYYSDGTNWVLQELPIYQKFKVFKVGATTFVTDNNGEVVQSGTDTAAAVQAQINAIPASFVYEFVWDADLFTIENPMIFPNFTNILSGTKKIIMNGSGFLGFRDVTTNGGSTCLIPSATFPTNRYFFELTSAVDSTNTGLVEINGFIASNPTDVATKNVGFVKLEVDGPAHGYDDYIVTRCFLNNMWRGLHLIGYVWFGRFENIISHDFTTSMIGDAFVTLEDGGHTTNNATPKVNIFRNLKVAHTQGTWNNCVRMKSGGYNVFENMFVDGLKYTVAVINLDNTDTLTTSSNTFQNLTTLDLSGVAPVPDNRQATLYLAGTAVYDNNFINFRSAPYPTQTVKLSGTGVVRNSIELAGYWGTFATITDTGAGEGNTYTIRGGHKTTAGDSKIVHTGGVGRIIDNRPGAEKGGIATSRTDGSTIAHGLFATPVWYHVTGTVAGEIVTATADATNLTLAIKKWTGGTLTTGTSQSVGWRAGAYA